jgi:hypothetical protein
LARQFRKIVRVAGSPGISVENDVGKVVLRSGAVEDVVIAGEIRHASCTVEQQGDEIRVIGRMDGQWYEWFYRWIEYLWKGWPKCDLEITLPHGSRVDIQSRTGSVQILDLRGDIRVRNQTGAIRVEKAEGKIQIHTSTGSVLLRDVQGIMEAEASTGGVRIEEASGKVKARSMTGSVYFRGFLASGEDHDFHTSTGSIHLSLKKPDAAFEARVGTGSIRCDPASAITRKEPHLVQGCFGDGSARLTVYAGTGSIHMKGEGY